MIILLVFIPTLFSFYFLIQIQWNLLCRMSEMEEKKLHATSGLRKCTWNLVVAVNWALLFQELIGALTVNNRPINPLLMCRKREHIFPQPT